MKTGKTCPMALQPGDQAPDFALKSKQGDDFQEYKLTDHRGKPVVLLFFPAAFSGVCQQELCDVSANLGRYNEVNAQVLGISVDSPFAQEAWANQNDIKFPLLSDYNREVTKAYGVELDFLGMGIASKRAVFVLDGEGKVVHMEVTPTPLEIPDFEKVLAALS